MQLVGWLLVAGLVIAGAGGGIGSARGFNAAFWKLPPDGKLDFVHGHRRDWWGIALAELVAVIVTTAGMVGLTYLLADAGEPVLASVALGGYLVTTSAWVFGLVAQTSGVPRAASQRADSGRSPDWIDGVWGAVYLAEGTWVIGANLAYIVAGVAVLQTGLVAAWAGWAAVALGAGIPLAVTAVRDFFPQLSLLVPFVFGIALLIS
jgi:hypothetical protein